jgi:hypothetical protein
MEDDDDALAAVGKNLKLAVSSSYASNAILLEVVKDLVRSKKNAGGKYLDDLFKRVSFRLDALDADDERHIGQTADTRAAVSTFFAWAKEAVPVRSRKAPSRTAAKKPRKPKRRRR